MMGNGSLVFIVIGASFFPFLQSSWAEKQVGEKSIFFDPSAVSRMNTMSELLFSVLSPLERETLSEGHRKSRVVESLTRGRIATVLGVDSVEVRDHFLKLANRQPVFSPQNRLHQYDRIRLLAETFVLSMMESIREKDQTYRQTSQRWGVVALRAVVEAYLTAGMTLGDNSLVFIVPSILPPLKSVMLYLDSRSRIRVFWSHVQTCLRWLESFRLSQHKFMGMDPEKFDQLLDFPTESLTGEDQVSHVIGRFEKWSMGKITAAAESTSPMELAVSACEILLIPTLESKD